MWILDWLGVALLVSLVLGAADNSGSSDGHGNAGGGLGFIALCVMCYYIYKFYLYNMAQV